MSTISLAVKLYLKTRQRQLLQVHNPLTPRRNLEQLTRLLPLLLPPPTQTQLTQTRV